MYIKEIFNSNVIGMVKKKHEFNEMFNFMRGCQ